MKRFATLFFALLGIASVAHADDQDNLLPVDQAFRVEATAPDRQTVQFKFAIADDYYLYRGRISTKAADAATTLGALDLPDGKKKHDEFLGDVEVYHHGFTATQHLTAAPDATNAVIELRYQGCHEVDPKICFPPQKKILTIALPAAPAATAPASLTAALGTATGNASASSLIGGNQPLPAEQAFRFEAIATGPDQVLARFTMPKGYYLYRDKTSFHTAADSGDSLGTPAFPAGTQHSDANFGATTVYFDQVDIPVPLSRTNNAAHTLALTANFQGCKENSVCYPMLERTLTVSLPAGSGAAVSVTPATATGSLLAALFAALLGGLVLNLMPCVLPVLSLKAISILESGESPVAARRHVLFYTAGVLISFAVVGLAVIALRKAGLIYGWGFQLQQPLFVAVLIYVIVAIGLSLSGVVQFGAGLG
ncbi:MAG: protein-disulfide reductase, partial [Proteobacteria bacterium]|nr:protein-disulfide reductase [Pseudomonadota bacterium]